MIRSLRGLEAEIYTDRQNSTRFIEWTRFRSISMLGCPSKMRIASKILLDSIFDFSRVCERLGGKVITEFDRARRVLSVCMSFSF